MRSRKPTPRPTALVLSLLALLALPPAYARAPVACADFHGNTNAAWLEAHPLAPGTAQVSALGELQARARQQQIDLLEAARNAPGDDVQKLLGDFWASGLDEAAVERDGANAIAPLLERIGAIRRDRDVAPAIAALHQVGIPVVFNFSADVDLADLTRHVGYFSQGGLGLPDPAYYTRSDADTQALLGRYRAYVEQILALTGTPADALSEQSALVVDLETRIARASRSPADLRDPRSRYALVPVDGFGKQYKKLQLEDFLEAQGVQAQQVSMADQALFQTLETLVDDLPVAQWRAYLQWRVGDAMAPYLARPFRDASFEFRGRVLEGLTAPPSREQQVLDAINLAAGPMLGHQYTLRYLDDATAARAKAVASQVRAVLGEALDADTRMGADAKAVARSKLAGLQIEIGRPQRDLDYSLQPMGRGSFGGNMLIASTWRHASEMRRIGQANAGRRWSVLPQTPALAYDISQNRLVVTAAMLQSPVLAPGDSEASAYGAYGALVGHELTHAFDARGRYVDDRLELRDWWSAADVTAWNGMAERIARQYSALAWPGLEGIQVNGMQTRDENVADVAGVELAWRAFGKAQPDAAKAEKQAFFEAWARLWAENAAPAEATRRASIGVHAPGQWRANQPLANLDDFGGLYGCRVGAVMRNKPEDRISVWPGLTPSE